MVLQPCIGFMGENRQDNLLQTISNHHGSDDFYPDIENAGQGVQGDGADAIPVHAAKSGRSTMESPSLRVSATYFQGKRALKRG